MIFGISMFKNEQDVARHTIVHLLEEGIDHILVADNLSTDGTRDILNEISGEYSNVTVLDDPDPAYLQSKKMSKLAEDAGSRGATWVVPFDADELWLAPDRVGSWLGSMSKNIQIAHADLYNHFPSAADTPGDNPFKSIVWRHPDRGKLPKVAFRYAPGVVVQQGNHGVEFQGKAQSGVGGDLTIRHFPYRSFQQFKAKSLAGAAAYAATDLPYTYGAHWRSYAQIHENGGDEALKEVFEKWFWFASPVDGGLIYDPAPFRRWS